LTRWVPSGLLVARATTSAASPPSERDARNARTRRVVFLSLALEIPETAALAAAAIATGSSALLAQTFAAAAGLCVQVFLVLGVLTSTRAPDASHPLGYGRERFFWSLYAAIGVFVAGFAVAFEEALRSIMHPTPLRSISIGYAVLGISIVLDAVAFASAARETGLRARALRQPVREFLRHTTETATVTELLANGIGIAGGALATIALTLTRVSGSTRPDAIASALIGIALVAAAVVLTQKNRALLTGRGIHPGLLADMQTLVAAQPGVVAVPDFFAIVVGPSTYIVDGDVTFARGLTVSELESTIDRAAAALKARWPQVAYVYLTPVSDRRPRGAHRAASDPPHG
jgi:cation diffusion facilitator family transporter